MNPLDLPTLRKLAEAATPDRALLDSLGRATLDGSICVVCRRWTPHDHPEAHYHRDDCRAHAAETAHDAAAVDLIAATDPGIVIALLDRLEAAEREAADLRRSRPINVPELAARLDGIRAEAAKGATPAALASMVEAVTYDLLPAPTGTGALIAARDAEMERVRSAPKESTAVP